MALVPLRRDSSEARSSVAEAEVARDGTAAGEAGSAGQASTARMARNTSLGAAARVISRPCCRITSFPRGRLAPHSSSCKSGTAAPESEKRSRGRRVDPVEPVVTCGPANWRAGRAHHPQSFRRDEDTWLGGTQVALWSHMRRKAVGCVMLAIVWLVSGSPVGAAPVEVRFIEGVTHGFLVLRSTTGQLVAHGDLLQITHPDRVESRMVFRFRDGSVYDERV